MFLLSQFLKDLAVYEWQTLKEYSREDFLRGVEKSREYAKFAIENGLAENFILKGDVPDNSVILDKILVNGSTVYRTYGTERNVGAGLKEFSDLEAALAHHIYWKSNNCAAGKR